MKLRAAKPPIEVPEGAQDELGVAARQHPERGWDFIHWRDDKAGVINDYAAPKVSQLLKRVRSELQDDGYSRLNFSRLLDSGQYNLPVAITLFLNGLGKPLRVFLDHPHWRKLNVKLDRPPDRSGGIGRSPLHQDFVNAANPPDFVCFFCIRKDPMGGGYSILSPIKGIERRIHKGYVEILSKRQFSDGRVDRLAGVGGDINPFAILALDQEWQYRFTGHLLRNAPSDEALRALTAVEQELENTAVECVLDQGELLVIDQRQFTHARGTLGAGQDTLTPDQQRLIMLSYLSAPMR